MGPVPESVLRRTTSAGRIVVDQGPGLTRIDLLGYGLGS
jgi:hypothetical protein